jgi:hypothetical protein
MDLLKKHYEKIVLGGVLLVLAVGAALLPMQISSERDELRQKETDIVSQPAKPLEPLNFVTQQMAVLQLRAAAQLDLSTTNKVLNPLLWQKTPEGKLIKFTTGEEAGPKALVVTKLTPLHLSISLDGVNTSEATPRYTITVEREAAADRNKRAKKPFFASLNNKNEVFTVREAGGAPDNPVLKLELADGGEIIEISKDKPFKRVDGYMADLKYSLEPNRPPWTAQRVGGALKFGGEDYIIVAITKNEVVVLAKSNQKKTPVPIQL